MEYVKLSLRELCGLKVLGCRTASCSTKTPVVRKRVVSLPVTVMKRIGKKEIPQAAFPGVRKIM